MNVVSVPQLIEAIRKLPSDAPRDDPRKWYRTQKEHWLGWLSEYDGPGAYGRIEGKSRDARFAYNHIVEPAMLLWLITTAGVKPELAEAARQASTEGRTLMQKSGAIRRHVPWNEVAQVLWNNG